MPSNETTVNLSEKTIFRIAARDAVSIVVVVASVVLGYAVVKADINALRTSVDQEHAVNEKQTQVMERLEGAILGLTGAVSKLEGRLERNAH